jgi:hypothetical protein
MTTHGTRSAYNKGCRCDMCREATRVARARQREIARTLDTTGSTDLGIAPPWVLLASLAGGGVFCLWHGRRIEAEDAETRAARRRWILAGLVLMGAAGGLGVMIVRWDS